MLEQIVKYRQVVILNDGKRILLRPLVKEDREALIALFEPLGPEDLKFMHSDVRSPDLVTSWVEHIDYKKTLPIVAVINDRIVGDATLAFRAGPGRHIADLRIFLSKEYRRCGLGSAMLRALIDIARKVGMQQIIAEIVADRTKVINAFKQIGFEQRAIFSDYFMMPDGETHDVVFMIATLGSKREEF